MRKPIIRKLCSIAALAVIALSVNMTVAAQAEPGTATTKSAASLLEGPLAIGSQAAGFGTGLANFTETAPDPRFPQISLAGARVTITDWFGDTYQARLFYASPTQINHEIPVNAAPGPAVITYTNTAGGQSVSRVDIAHISPGLFSVHGTGSGIANAVLLRKLNGVDRYEQPYRFENGQFIPVPIEFGPESEVLVLALFGTGFRFRSSLANMTVMIGGIPLEVIYAGRNGDNFECIDQANVILPRSLAGAASVGITLTVDGLISNTVQLDFR